MSGSCHGLGGHGHGTPAPHVPPASTAIRSPCKPLPATLSTNTPGVPVFVWAPQLGHTVKLLCPLPTVPQTWPLSAASCSVGGVSSSPLRDKRHATVPAAAVLAPGNDCRHARPCHAFHPPHGCLPEPLVRIWRPLVHWQGWLRLEWHHLPLGPESMSCGDPRAAAVAGGNHGPGWLSWHQVPPATRVWQHPILGFRRPGCVACEPVSADS